MNIYFQVIISVIVGITTGLLSNIIANWLQPTANRFRKTAVSIFIGLIVCSLALAVVSTNNTIANTNRSLVISRFGRVINNQTQNPVVAAAVIIEVEGVPQIKYTDSEGVYRFDLQLDRDITQINVKISAKGYIYYERNIPIYAHIPQVDDIRLEPHTVSANTPESVVAATTIPAPTTETSNPTNILQYESKNSPPMGTPPSATPIQYLKTQDIWTYKGMQLELFTIDLRGNYPSIIWRVTNKSNDKLTI